MRFSPDFIEKVRDANNVVDVLSEYTTLKRSGSRLMGLCPFPGHKEKTPSFSVSEDKQVFHCFGCKRSGQIFTALQELKGMSFPEAVEYLASRAGIAMPEGTYTERPDAAKIKTKKSKLLKLNEVAMKFYSEQLAKSPSAIKDYVKSRGLKQSAELYRLGYAPPEWESLSNVLLKMKAPMELAAEIGLVRQRKDGRGYFDLFRDRLMFPIFSAKGEVVGFGGRALSKEQTPKYLNSPESEIFLKGETFYGLHESAKHIRAEDSVLVVEGYMDLLALYEAGIKNVVATLGTALTVAHAKVLKRLTSNVVVLFDGDDAGQTAGERSLPILLNAGLLPKGVKLPNKLDPDDFVKKYGAAELQKVISSAPDLFSTILDRKLIDYPVSSAAKTALLHELSHIVQVVSDRQLKELYLSELAERLGVEVSWVEKHLNTANRAQNRQGVAISGAPQADFVPKLTEKVVRPVEQEGDKIVLKGAPKAELFLLNLALLSSERFNRIWASEIVGELAHPGVQELFMKAYERFRHYGQIPSEFDKLTAYLMSLVKSPEAVGWHLGEPLCNLDEQELDKLIDDCTRQVRERFLRKKSRELAAGLRTDAPSDQLSKLEQIMNIQKDKHSLRRDRES